MRNVRILDCTLRDGGRIIDCAFPNNEIRDITERLANAKIEIIEVGFLRDWRKNVFEGNTTFFTDVDQIIPFIDKSKSCLYVAFIDYGMFDIDSLKEYNGKSIDGIRFGFTKKDYTESREDVFRWISIIKKKGYKLFVQGVNTLSYSDDELLQLTKMMNDVQPYSFGIVDTYGAMYMDDVDRIFGLIDHNLNHDICIDFHSHNNYQLSFALAQEVIRLGSIGNRNIIIDGTLGGMGKVAGNLNTELIVDFMVRKKLYDYEFEDILDILDDYIVKYSLNHKWGYSTPAMMAAVYKAHPNNIIYLTEKYRLDTKDIGKILSMIDPAVRQKYDFDTIERLYAEYVADKVDDYDSVQFLKGIIEEKTVLVLVPGASVNTYWGDVEQFYNNHRPVVVSVNFFANISGSMAFFGNSKRYGKEKSKRTTQKIIISSNIHADTNDIVVNYHSLINRGYKYFENSTIMLLNLLKRCNPRKIVIAGFDGFDENLKQNYQDSTFQNERHVKEFSALNAEVADMFENIVETMNQTCEFSMLTPSKYSFVLEKVRKKEDE